jgi:hypothetical protein
MTPTSKLTNPVLFHSRNNLEFRCQNCTNCMYKAVQQDQRYVQVEDKYKFKIIVKVLTVFPVGW